MIGFADFECHTVRHRNFTGGRFSGPYPSRRQWGRTRRMIEQLLSGSLIEFLGKPRGAVTALTTDSRRVIPGALFFAVKGTRSDGNLFIDEAISRGACGVVTEHELSVKVPLFQVRVQDVRLALAEAARKFYGFPDRKLTVTGVTGTNGKTTVTHMVKYLQECTHKEPVGMLGTVCYDLGERTLPSFRTTPDAVDTFAMLEHMVRAGCHHAVMEVSSHGLDQCRVRDLEFDTAVFTNLTRDHLDYHPDMEAYFACKKQLFDGGNGKAPRHAVIGIDTEWGRRLANEIPHCLTCGFAEDAALRVESLYREPGGSGFRLQYQGETGEGFLPMPGLYNLANMVCALGVIAVQGGDIWKVLPMLASLPGVPGRMEEVTEGYQPWHIFVDYAHTGDALENALKMLREVNPGRVHVVFGCGGNRDRAKRVEMTKAALTYADVCWATADNPRSETVENIFKDMRSGLPDGANLQFVSDRREAISRAIDGLRAGEILLVAGKGHETFQEFADRIVPFDDRVVIRELLQMKELLGD